MPTKLPRVNVVLSQEQYDLLTRLSRIQGRSRSAIMAELLELARDTLTKMADSFEEVHAIAKRAKSEFRGDLGKAQQAAAAWALRSVQDAERMLRDVQEEAAAYKAQLVIEVEAAADAQRPTVPAPPTNRGADETVDNSTPDPEYVLHDGYTYRLAVYPVDVGEWSYDVAVAEWDEGSGGRPVQRFHPFAGAGGFPDAHEARESALAVIGV